MKKIAKITAILLLSLILVAPVSALRSTVYFLGQADSFVFHPGSDWSDTDLFDGFKNVMPGDKVTELLEVRNVASDCDTVKIFLKAETPEAVDGETASSMADFLAQLSMKVEQDGTVIYEASPDQLAGLADYVQLGAFAAGESTNLNITLVVPTTLGSEYMHRSGAVDWTFMAECYVDGEIVEPDEPDGPLPPPNPNPNGPQTFDYIVQYFGLFLASVLGLIIAIALIRKYQKEDETA